MSCFLYPEDVDRRLSWPPGTAQRMARQRRLPHTVLPDGSVRFEWAEVEALLRHVPARPRLAVTSPDASGP
jgi:hypothetical protein